MKDSSLPEGWVDTTFGEVTDVVSGGTPRAADQRNFAAPGTGIPWITPADLSRHSFKYIRHGARDLSEVGYHTSSARLMPKDSVLLSSRAPIGYVAIAANPLCTNQGFKSFVLPDGIDSTYVYYYLKHIRDIAESLGTGTTFKELSLTATKRLPLRLAPSAIQVLIGRQLDDLCTRLQHVRKGLTNARETIRQFRSAVLSSAILGRLTEDWRQEHEATIKSAQHTLDRLRTSRISSAATAAEVKRLESIYASADESIDFTIPETWTTANLEKLAISFEYGSSSKSHRQGAIPVLRMGNIQDGKLSWDDLAYTSNPAEIERYRLHKGDVLFNRTNSPALVGKTAVYNGERDAIFAGYLIRVRTTVALDPDYLSICLNSFHGRQFAWKAKIDGVSQSNINATKLKQFPVPLPSLDEQRAIVQEVKRLLEFADNIEKAIDESVATVERLEPSMLEQAFNGKLVSTAEYDEPAAELIARLVRDRRNRVDPGAAKKPRKGKANVTNENQSHRRSIVDVLREHESKLTAKELFLAAGYPSDADVATVEEFLLEVRSRLLDGAIEKQRVGNEDYFSAGDGSGGY
ncbi:restriction endonuclease subunit S [Burkholderia multivorans]|uniref:restriction endonuclease subunit S n=1 Tax=Burkholderia multivorans TaxID=87883 RepID=UPI0009BF3187|nr:restriction endonuclease subunit S [Burkholderia multivorans]